MEFKAEEGSQGRLDCFVSDHVPELTRSYLRKLILQGDILLNGETSKPGQMVRVGDTVTGELPNPEPLDAKPQDLPLDILYEDPDIIVVNKARGMVTHPAPGTPDGTLVNALLHHTTELSGINGVLRPGIIHRLDKDTSGVLVVAKNDVAHQGLASQLEARAFEKEYIALVRGIVKDDEGTVDVPLWRNLRDRRQMAVAPAGRGREAVTHYKVIKRFKGHTLLRIRIETGRTHQIRVHMKYMGHPIEGDPVYGPRDDPMHLGGQFLHARQLGFVHPVSGEHMTFRAPLPEKLSSALRTLSGTSMDKR